MKDLGHSSQQPLLVVFNWFLVLLFVSNDVIVYQYIQFVNMLVAI